MGSEWTHFYFSKCIIGQRFSRLCAMQMTAECVLVVADMAKDESN